MRKRKELPPKKPLEESTIKSKSSGKELFKTKPLVTDTRFNFPIDVDEKPETRQRYNEYSTRKHYLKTNIKVEI